MTKVFEHEAKPLKQNDRLSGVAVLRLDNFEQFELAAGEEAGTAWLERLTAELGLLFGANNLRLRRGGWGFCVELRQAEREASLELIHCAIDAICSGSGSHGVASPISTCVGVAWLEGDSSESSAEASIITELRQKALASVAVALAQRKRLVVWGEDGEKMRRNAALLCDLRAAMAEDRVTIMAQEISGAPVGQGKRHYEILVQMVDRQGNRQPPARFLPLAEQSALIEALDRWVFHKVLIGYGAELQARPWISLSFNLSGRSLAQKDTWSVMEAIIRQSGIAPERLRLEITETALISDMAVAQANVWAARAAGLGVSLDDFGAGLSSFAYLAAFDVDSLKIDGALVRKVTEHGSAEQEILRSILALARKLNLEVVAEHVSSPEILMALDKMGISQLQGYEVALPCYIEEIFC